MGIYTIRLFSYKEIGVLGQYCDICKTISDPPFDTIFSRYLVGYYGCIPYTQVNPE